MKEWERRASRSVKSSAASLEQAQGIEQVNKAVGEVDKVIQQNAAGAEEAASVSAEMHTRSDEVRRISKELWTLVNRWRHAMQERRGGYRPHAFFYCLPCSSFFLNSKRFTLPVAVFGNSSMNSIQRGYL